MRDSPLAIGRTPLLVALGGFMMDSLRLGRPNAVPSPYRAPTPRPAVRAKPAARDTVAKRDSLPLRYSPRGCMPE